ncbi:MAG: hypothetical protein KGL39_48290 [Patescibacteria group bacterium]|nr:hypothetical protein [Patescibacteria group bacterium]
MAGPASSSNNPGPATLTGNDYAGGASPYQVGIQASSLVGFYGVTPVVQRATASTHSTSNAASSSAFGASQSAVLVEIMNTLISLGIWAS